MLMYGDALQEQGDSMTTVVEAMVRWKPNRIKPFELLCILLKTSDVRWDINVSDAVFDPLSNTTTTWRDTGEPSLLMAMDDAV